MPDRPLWSERHGGSLALTDEGFATLLVAALERLKAGGYFAEVLDMGRRWSLGGRQRTDTARAFFSMRLGDPWAAAGMTSVVTLTFEDDARIFDLLELLHHDVVSEPVVPLPAADESEKALPSLETVVEQMAQPTEYDKSAGQEALRRRINPILARRDPPLEMDTAGVIVQRVAEPFRRLVEQPLPETAPRREVVERVDDAIAHFRRRTATAGDRRAAVRELADVLEFLRSDVKEHMLSKDERDLFRIANDFALRHNKPTTRRDFEEPVWLAWLFYVYLATIRLALELSRRST